VSISWITETHESVKSTQDIIKGMAEIGHPEGMVVRADEQTGGHGRHGRVWVSKKGNLFMSVLLRPSCHVQSIGLLSLLSGLAAAKAIQKHLDNPEVLTLKWPNDIFLGGEKCAGILLETALGASGAVQWLALGIGVNIENAPLGEGDCIAAYSENPPKPQALCKEILKQIDTYYTEWSRDGGAEIRREWLALAHKKGTKLRIRIGPQIEQGSFYDVDAQGNLLLQDSELRLKTVTAGEVYI
jgi:BirA family biotin operon repressor/biotin-[acetyl-CoA-carboxylase] ligase